MQTGEITYNITKHAKERYALRIANKDEQLDIQRFIVLNDEKIQSDITKMITYGKMIYTGSQTQKDGKTSIINVYLNGCWIVLVDNRNNNVITLYKIDLHCGDDLNTEYINRMIEKLDAAKLKRADAQIKTHEENESYRELITQYQNQIIEYRGMIKNLEDLIDGYSQVIKNNNVLTSQADREVADIVNDMIGKKEF